MSRRTRKNVGVIGLGEIGSRVTANLRKKGFHVFVWNDIPQPVPNFVGAPAELAEMCDFVQIFVSEDDAVLQVSRQLAPALAPRHIVIVHSTVTPQTMREAANIVERRGARFLEAPFTGGERSAERGELLFYVGGDVMAFQDARPILEANAREIMMAGEIGQATATKVAANIIAAATVQAAAEALALVHTVGLPLERLLEAVQSTSSFSKNLATKLPKMIETNFEPNFSIKEMLNDVQIASRLGLSCHLELAVTSAIRDRLLEQMQHGYGDEDYCAVARKFFAVAVPTKPQPVPPPQLEQPDVSAQPSPIPQAAEAPPPKETPPFISVVLAPTQASRTSAEVPGPIPEFTPIAPVAEDREPQPEKAASHSEPAVVVVPEIPKGPVISGTELGPDLLRRLLQGESNR